MALTFDASQTSSDKESGLQSQLWEYSIIQNKWTLVQNVPESFLLRISACVEARGCATYNQSHDEIHIYFNSLLFTYAISFEDCDLKICETLSSYNEFQRDNAQRRIRQDFSFVSFGCFMFLIGGVNRISKVILLWLILMHA